MFAELIALFKNPQAYTTPLPASDANHALGALMVRAAKADGSYLFQEIALIDQILAQRNGLNPVEAAKMRASCEMLEKELPGNAEMLSAIPDLIGESEREAMLSALWQVVFADGIEHASEAAVLHEVETLFGIAPVRARALHDAVQGTLSEFGRSI